MISLAIFLLAALISGVSGLQTERYTAPFAAVDTFTFPHIIVFHHSNLDDVMTVCAIQNAIEAELPVVDIDLDREPPDSPAPQFSETAVFVQMDDGGVPVLLMDGFTQSRNVDLARALADMIRLSVLEGKREDVIWTTPENYEQLIADADNDNEKVLTYVYAERWEDADTYLKSFVQAATFLKNEKNAAKMVVLDCGKDDTTITYCFYQMMAQGPRFYFYYNGYYPYQGKPVAGDFVAAGRLDRQDAELVDYNGNPPTTIAKWNEYMEKAGAA